MFIEDITIARQDDEEIKSRMYERELITSTDCAGMDFQSVTFDGCRFIECDLSKASFYDCKFLRCDLSNCKLPDSYWKDCDISGIALSDTFYELRGAEVSYDQAAELAALLGVKIK